ncbi:hypothetical protein ACH4SK_42280 [Streptomyces inhibens]|uniref:hypothetical protein n=1 Tax=Streptomyces inhibens TaxID=2293571 RepID=UPI0037A7523A
MAMLFVGTAIAAPPRRARRVDASWVALRATATGLAEHVAQPSGDDTGPGDDKRDGKPDDKAGATTSATTSAKKSTARYPCLILRTEAGDIPLNLPGRRRPTDPPARARRSLAAHGAHRRAARHDLLGRRRGDAAPPGDGGWRLWTAVAGALAPLLVWMAGGLFAAPAAETRAAQAEVQAGGGRAA